MTRGTKIVVGVVAIGALGTCGLGVTLWYLFVHEPPAPQEVRVTVPAPGADVAEADSVVCPPVARAAASAVESAETWSEAREGACVVHVRVGEAPEEGLAVRVRDAVSALDLPEAPVVQAGAARSMDVHVVVAADGPLDTSSAIAEFGLRPRIEGVPGVVTVEVCGVDHVTEGRLDAARAFSHGVSAADVEHAIAGAFDAPGGEVELASGERVLVGAGVRPPLEGVAVGHVRLEDLATIVEAPRPRSRTAFRDGAAVAALRVSIDSSRATEVLSEIRARLADPELGAPLSLLADATERWTLRTVPAPRVQTERTAGAISRALGADALVRLDRDGGDLVIAAPAGLADRVTGAITSQPGVVLASAPRGVARVWIRGGDRAALDPVVARVLDALAGADLHAATLAPPPRPTIDVRVDRERAAALGLREQDIARAVQLAHGVEVSRIYQGGRERSILLRVGGAAPDDPEAVRHVRVGNVPIAAVAALEHAEQPIALHRRGPDPAVGIHVSVDPDYRGDPLAAATDALATDALPAGVTVELSPL